MITAQRLRRNPGDPYWNTNTLVLPGSGANNAVNIVDRSRSNQAITLVGDTKFSTAVVKYGSSSILTDGAGDGLSIANNAGLKFAGNPWTIEMWLYFRSLPGGGVPRQIIDPDDSAGNNLSYAIITLGSEFKYYLSSNGTSWNVVSGNAFGGVLSINTWYHLSLTRVGNNIYAAQNGVIGSTTAIGAVSLANFTSPISIGRHQTGIHHTDAYWCDIRINNGVGRYSANFTPPRFSNPLH